MISSTSRWHQLGRYSRRDGSLLREEESRDGQSSEVLKNQNMLHIMSENEKDLSYSLGVNQFTDLTKEEFESTYLGYKPQNMIMSVTTLG